MTAATESMRDEFREEAAITKRVLDRVPANKLAWRPHPKSMSLGQLAMHIARVPGDLAKLLQLDEFDASQANFDPPAPKDMGEIHATLEQSVRDAEALLNSMSDQNAQSNWRLIVHGRPVFDQPRIQVARSIMMNHWYHHRGQLSVYLRLLGVPVPVIYGRSADENPFA